MTVALWCVLAVGFLPYVLTAVAKAGSGDDNRAPRDAAVKLAGYRRRAYAAQLNGFEAFPFFAVAVLVAETRGAPRGALDALALAFVLTRITHAVAYVADRAKLRSIIWSIGFVLALAIFCLPLWHQR